MRSWWFCCLAFPYLKLQLGQFPLCLCFSVISREMVGHWREVALCVFAKIQPRWLSVGQQDIVCVSNGDTEAHREAEHAGPRSDLPFEARGCPGRFTGCSGTLNSVPLRVACAHSRREPSHLPRDTLFRFKASPAIGASFQEKWTGKPHAAAGTCKGRPQRSGVPFMWHVTFGWRKGFI